MKSIFVVVISMLLSSVLFAQTSRNDLKGPKAKNYKYWEGKVSFEKVEPVQKLKGPEAKNYSPTKNIDWSVASQPLDQEKYRRVMGPKAKNMSVRERNKRAYSGS